MPFNTFNVQDVQAHTQTSVVEGARDDSLSTMLGLGFEVGRGVMAGRAMARLTGAEATADSVQQEDVYGTYTREEGEPAQLAIDQDLTRITNARKQGNISAERARALVNIRLRQAINDNPMFTKELTARAQSFFDEIGGGAGRTAGGDILSPTSEEQLETKLEQDRITALNREQLEAEQLGMTVQEYRKRQRHMDDIAYSNAVLEGMTREMEHEQALTDQDRMMQNRDFTRHLGNHRAGVQVELMRDIGQYMEERGGVIDPQTRQGLRNRVQKEFGQMTAWLDMQAAYMDAQETTRHRNALESWRDNIIGTIEEADMESLATTMRDYNNVVADLHVQHELPDLWALGRIDSSLVERAITLYSNEDKLRMTARFDPIAQFALEFSETAGEGIPGMMKYRAKQIETIATGSPEARAQLPGSEEEKDNALDSIELDFISSREEGSDLLEENSWQDFPNILNRQGGVAFNAAATPKTVKKVNKDPEKQRILTQNFDRYTRAVQSAIRQGNLDMSEISIRENEFSPREIGRYSDSFLTREYWNNRRHGDRAGPSLIVEAGGPRERRSRLMFGTGVDPHDPRGIQHSAVADYSDEDRGINNIVSDLQALVNVADAYPNLEVEGQPMRDVLMERLGIGEQTTDSAEPQPDVGTSVQDVEWDEPTIGGEASPTQLEMSGDGVRQEPIPGPWQRGEAMEPGARENVIQGVLEHLPRREGRGTDVAGDVPTGSFGITQSALNQIGWNDRNPEELSDDEAMEAARIFTEQAYDHMASNMEAFINAPEEVQEEIIDASYNLGFHNVSRYPALNRKLEQGDWLGAMREGLLDTATANGQSLRGLAVRRSENYNRVAEMLGEPTIQQVEQMEDGLIIYRDSEGREIFRFRPRNGRHSDSGTGTINV